MRIRRKKHLDERLKQLSDIIIVPDRDIVNVKEAIKSKRYFDFVSMFGNNNPVEMEIGCGKGGFIVQKAILNPNVNYIAVELLNNIIVMAGELAKQKGLKNVRFINSGAEYLTRYIREQSINNIYLNFSPPYPQQGYESRRLTSDRFVLAYKSFLSTGGAIYQKTDDEEFFNYSLQKFVEHGFKVKDITKEITKAQLKVNKVATDLKYGEDYEIVGYEKNINKGTAKVTFKGVGNYGGEKTVTFKIVQKNVVNHWWSGIVEALFH